MTRAALILILAALAVAGCGSGAKSPSVASLGTSALTTTSQDATPPPVGGTSSGSGGGGGQLQMKVSGGLKFSQCMRAHGVSKFPDPGAQGAVTINSRSGIDPNSPVFRSAQQACQKNLPNGGQPTPQQIAKIKKAALAFSACMRAHGLKDFPDPTFGNGAGGIKIAIGVRGHSGLNPNNPIFKKAQSACAGKLGRLGK